MDKETLSNYGWIVICVLVLAVMIALATPFGTFVADAIKSTTQGLFDVNQNALNSTGLINIGDQSFGEGGNGGQGENGETPVIPDEPEVVYTNWEFKDWNIGLQGDEIWTDGTNVYRGLSYVLNGDTWEKTTFNNTPNHFKVENIWTDGTNTYHSAHDKSAAWNNEHHVLVGNTWVEKEWKGFKEFYGEGVWTDGTNTYVSVYSSSRCKYMHFVLNGDTWEEKVWDGFTKFYGSFIWTDGTKMYYSGHGTNNYVLNGNTWEEKVWDGFAPNYGNYIWTDGTNTYYAYEKTHYVLQDGKWVEKTWSGLTLHGYDYTNFYAENVWTDGTNIYHSNGSYQYVLVKK